MNTSPDDDRDRPDEIDQVEETGPEFGEADDAAQRDEWEEDAREGGV